MYDEVENRRQKLDAFRPFGSGVLRRLDAVFEPRFIYASNAIEGNTLTLGETQYITQEGRLPAGKREEEYWEVKGQQAAYEYLRQAVLGGFELSEKLIREFHELLTGRLDNEKYRPGQYKERENQVLLADGSLFPYVSHVETPRVMRDMVAWYRGPGSSLHPLEKAAWLHYKFILTHPFRDGNGRTARLLANLSLMIDGCCMLIFRAGERRDVYLNALRLVDESVPRSDLHPDNTALNIFPFVTYMEQELLASYDLALDVVEGRILTEPDDLARSFSTLEAKALAKIGIATDEQSRLVALGQSVQAGTTKVYSEVESMVGSINATLREFRVESGTCIGGAADNMPSYYRSALNLGNLPARGLLGEVVVRFAQMPNKVTELLVPASRCAFLLYAEPHALTLACALIGVDMEQHGLDESACYSRIRLPLDLTLWRIQELRQFLLFQLNRFGQLSIG